MEASAVPYGPTTPTVLSTRRGAIVHLAFNRHESRNALTAPMYEALVERLAQAGADPEISAVILSGAGGWFCAGNDLEEFAVEPTELAAMRFFHAAADFPKPLLAAVEGVAIGIGTTLLLHCDFAYAGASTRFAAPFVKLGASPEGASSLLLAQVAGSKRAAEILLLGEPFDAPGALAAGLLTAIVDDGAAVAAAEATAERLVALPPLAVAETKRLMRAGQRQTIAEVIDREEQVFLRLLQTEPAQAAIRAFLARRRG